MKGWARRRHDWPLYLDLHGGGERTDAFVEICHLLEPAEYWILMRSVWVGGEFFEPRELWALLLAAHPEHRRGMMTIEEVALLERMPDVLTVYRGAGHDALLTGFSWTLDRDRAVWFSSRFSQADRELVTATIEQESVIAFIDDRQEQEIIALPDEVQVTDVATIGLVEAMAALEKHGGAM